MKITFQKISRWLLLACLLASLGRFSSLAATLTVSPAVISNTYPGVITLQIGGLTNSETVTVQKWLDANANGSIDAGEPVMEVIKIADGGAMIIGGITNINVPFDSNSNTGAITTRLNFAPPLAVENVVGKFIFKLLSPTGNFPPVTATFTVTNAATAQSVSGVIYSNGVAPLPGAIVVAIQQPNFNYAGGAVADATGHYSLNLNPGTYALIAGNPGYYYDEALAPLVVLTNGVSATNNLSLTNGAVTISGNVFDAGNSNGVGGVMLQIEQSGGSLFAIAFTDTNGNYSAAVAPSFWKISPIKERLARRAYVSPQNKLQVNATAGNVTNASISLFKGTALFYGRITDNASVPFANIEFDCGDGGTNNLYSAKGVSDANGYYAVVALGGVSSDWNSSPTSGNNLALANYVVNSFNNTNIALGQAILQNYLPLPVTGHISGRVLDNVGNPVTGVSLYASQFTSGNNYSSLNSETDVSGNYLLGVANGSWQVYFSFGNNDLSTHGLVDLFQPYNVTIPPTNVTLNITVYPFGSTAMSQPQRFSSTQFGFNLNGSVGVTYDVQTSTNLASTNWATLFSLTLTNSPFPVTDTHATNSQRYYRVKKN